MNPEDATQRTLEVVVSEKVFSRLKTQMLLVYGVSFALASIIAWSLTWQYRALSDLASSRISEYQLLVADGLHELHKLDLDEGGDAHTAGRGLCRASSGGRRRSDAHPRARSSPGARGAPRARQKSAELRCMRHRRGGASLRRRGEHGESGYRLSVCCWAAPRIPSGDSSTVTGWPAASASRR